MSEETFRIRLVVVWGAGVATALPPIVFIASGLLAGMGVGELGSALVEQYSTDRLNLFVLGFVGLIPFLFLSVSLFVLRRLGQVEPLRFMAWGGGVMVALLLLWAHASYWPDFLPDRVAPGWPHGIAFVVVPLIYAPIGALVGMVVGVVVHKTGDQP